VRPSILGDASRHLNLIIARGHHAPNDFLDGAFTLARVIEKGHSGPKVFRKCVAKSFECVALNETFSRFRVLRETKTRNQVVRDEVQVFSTIKGLKADRRLPS
jgi:hypothetical protein